MEISLSSPRTRWVILGIAAVSSVLLGYLAWRTWRAAAFLQSDQLPLMQRSLRMEPGDAEAWDRLGRYTQWFADPPDAPESIAYYQRAVGINPRSARYWVDLAEAFEADGQTERAASAFENARAAYPASAEILFDYGNFLLRQKQFHDAFAAMRRATESDPSLLPLAITRCWLATGEVKPLLDEALPQTPEAYLQALSFFADSQEADAGMETWRRLYALRQPFSLPRIFPFLDELLRQERTSDALQMWKEAQRVLGMPPAEGTDGSVVWNGGFETEPVNGGLDWRFEQLEGIVVGIDPAVRHSGSQSLRMDFAGGDNYDIHQPFEIVCVEPGRNYNFQAYVRTEGITTESGIRFVLFDPHHPEIPPVSTPDLTDTHDWILLQADYRTSPLTRVLQIQVQRTPSRLFENKLGGTAWVDDVALTPAHAPLHQVSP